MQERHWGNGIGENAWSLARLTMSISRSKPAVRFPNYGSVVHSSVLGREHGYGSEISNAIGVHGGHYGTDMVQDSEVHQEYVNFTWSRMWYVKNSTPYHGDQVSMFRTTIHQACTFPTDKVGISLDYYSLYRDSRRHQEYAGSYVSMRILYTTQSNPSVKKVVDHGLLFRWGVGWGNGVWPAPGLPNPSGFARQYPYNYVLTDSAGIRDVWVEVTFSPGWTRYRYPGDGPTPHNWSPNDPVATEIHPVGIGANHWNVLNATHYNQDTPVIHACSLKFRVTDADLRPPKKIRSPYSLVKHNNVVYTKIGTHDTPWWHAYPPY